MVLLQYLDINKNEKGNIWDLFLSNDRKHGFILYICDQCLKNFTITVAVIPGQKSNNCTQYNINLLTNLEIYLIIKFHI